MQSIIQSINDKTYSSFSPLNLTGCTLWLDAADASCVSQTNNTITTLTDKSIFANHAVAVGNVFWGGSNTINSLSALRFSGAQMTLTGNKMPWQSGCSFTAFVLNRPAGALSASQVMLAWGSFSANRAISIYHFNWYPVFEIFGGSKTQASFTAGTTDVSNTTNIVTCIGQSGTAPTLRGWCNGYFNSFTSVSNGAFTLNPNSVTANIGSNNNTFNYYTGTMGEIIMYNRALAPLELMQVEGYLSKKWGISTLRGNNFRSLSFNHAFGQLTPFTRPFLPLDAPSLSAWYDASDVTSYSITAANNVFWWADKSGNNFHVYNSITTKGPLAYPSSTSNTLYFQNTNSHTLVNYGLFVNIQNHHLIAVHKPSITNGNYTGNTSLFRWQDLSNYIVFPYMEATTPRGYISSFGAGLAANQSTLTDGSTNTGFQIIEASIQNTSQTVYRNASVTSVSAATLANSTYTASFTMGSLFSASEFYAGQLQEMIIYGNNLNNIYRQPLESYLAYKWRLSSLLPSNTTNFWYSKFPGYTTLWNPKCIPSLTLWIDPSDVSTLTPWGGTAAPGQSISSIVTKGYIATTFVPTQGAPALSPRLNSYSSNSTNLMVLDVSGASGAGLWSNASNAEFVNSFTMFAYFSKSTGNQPIMHHSGTSGLRSFSRLFIGQQDVFVTSGTTFSSLTNLGTAAGWYLYSNGYSNSTSLSNAYRINFTNCSATGAVAVPLFSQSGRYIIGNLSSNQLFSYSLAEFLLYKGSLSPFELQQVEGYLAHKWGLQSLMPSTHPFKEYPPGIINTAQFNAG